MASYYSGYDYFSNSQAQQLTIVTFSINFIKISEIYACNKQN